MQVQEHRSSTQLFRLLLPKLGINTYLLPMDFVINSLQNFTLLTPANSIFTPNIILFQWKFQVLFVRHLSTLSADKFFLEGTSGGVFSLCFNLLYSSRCKNCIPRILQLTNVIGYKIIFVIARLSSTLVT